MVLRSELPIIQQSGRFRAQLSNLRITDGELLNVLTRAKKQLIEMHAKQMSCNADGVRFEDVPLIEVTLNRNQLTDAAMTLVTEFLLSNSHIESFEILGNQLTDAAAAHVEELMVKSKLHRIKVGDNQFTAEGARVMSTGLQRANDRFVQLHVGGNPIGDDGVTALCDACFGSRVEVLGLRDTNVNGHGWLSVATMALKNSHVVEVQMKGNRLSKEAADGLQELVASANTKPEFDGYNSLLILSISGCHIDGSLFKQAIGFISLYPRLTQLDLSNNPLGDEGVAYLLRWLEGGSAGAIRSLNLQRTSITHVGLQSLIPLDKGRSCALSRLCDLDMSYNEFGVEGTSSVTALLDTCPNLERLMLHRCLLGGPALPQLCASVASHPNVRDFDFSSNFSEMRGDAWDQVLRCNKKLERLLLTDNGMPSTVTSRLVQTVLLSSRSTLKMLQIGGQSKVAPCANAVLPAVHVALVQCLARNRGEVPKAAPPSGPSQISASAKKPPSAAAAAAQKPHGSTQNIAPLPSYSATITGFCGHHGKQPLALPPGLFAAQSSQHIAAMRVAAQPLQLYQQPQYAAHQPLSFFTTSNGRAADQCFFAQGPQVLSADGLTTFAPADFHSLSAPPGTTIVWCPVVSENGAVGGVPQGALQCSW